MLSRFQFSLGHASLSPLVSVSMPTQNPDGTIGFEPEECNLVGARRSPKLVLLSSDYQLCTRVHSYLQRVGFCVFTCTSFDRAERLFLGRRDIDLWLVDVEALGIEAMYLATKARDLHRDVPVILISGAVQKNDAVRPVFLESWIRIIKPIQLPALLTVIHRALRNVGEMPKVKKLFEDSESFENDWINQLRKAGSRSHLLN